jgi:hypothetical protein
MNYYLPPMEHISCGTGIPLAILRGVQAGALTGSETDTSNLWGMISGEQSAYENGIRQFIRALTGVDSDYVFNWKSGFEMDEQKKAQVEYTKAQTYDYLWNFLKRNEIRKKIDPDLPDLSAEEGGEDLKTKNNGPEPEVKLNPLTGEPMQPFGNGNPTQKLPSQIQEQINQGDASYIITELPKPHINVAADDEGRWVTINGVHILIKEGESVSEAFKRTTGKDIKSTDKKVKVNKNALWDHEEEKQEVTRILDKLPSEDVSGIKAVELVNPGDKRLLKLSERTGFEVGGHYDFSKGKILVSTSEENIVYHEVGHHVFDKVLSYEQQDSFKAIWSANTDLLPSDYAKTNVQEGFSECYYNFNAEIPIEAPFNEFFKQLRGKK